VLLNIAPGVGGLGNLPEVIDWKCLTQLAGKKSRCQTKGILPPGDTGKVIDSEWAAQISEATRARRESRRADAFPAQLETLATLNLATRGLNESNRKMPRNRVASFASTLACFESAWHADRQ
jgi:hypothetical protein